MRNNKAHLNAPGLIVKTMVVGSAGILTAMVIMGKNVPSTTIAGFAALIFFAQFLNMMFGMNPLGTITGMIVALFALVMLKAVYSYPDTAFGQFFVTNITIIAPTLAGIDIFRDIID
ncbi:MAG: hypothetical protein ABIF92_02345 [archaeon]